MPLPKLDNLFGPDGTVATKNSASGGPTDAASGASPSAASQEAVMDAEAARRAAEKARKEEEAALWMEAAQYSLMGGDPGLLVVASEKVVGVTTADDMNAAMMQVLRQADSSKVQRRVMQVMPRSSVVCPRGGRGTTVAHVSTTCGACSEPPS